jgi:hypothetical protein
LYHLLEHAVIKSCLFSERENLRALRRVYKLVKEIQVPVQTVLQYTLRGGVQAPYCLIDKIDVDCAEVIEITRIRVESIAVDSTIVGTGANRMGGHNNVDPIGSHRLRSSEEIFRVLHVAEEADSSIKIELAIWLTAIDKKVDWEHGFCIGCEETGRDK